ncbi:MAG: hypothetical protein VKP57_08810 [Candidatus Sericytochromatia bacterium]|nr:hypothetical protein [Candidatus Sericytochromatia bacterium]
MPPTPAGPIRPSATPTLPASSGRVPAGTGPLPPAELDRWVAGGNASRDTARADGDGRPGILSLSGTRVGDLMDKAASRLGEQVLYRDYGVRPPSLSLGGPGGIGFALRVHALRDTDGRVQDDPHRRETSRRMAEAGTPVTWAEVRGAVEPWAGYPFSIPALGAGVTIGFTTDASVALSVLSPHRHPLRQTVADLGIHLPFRAEEAMAYAEGTEVELRGRGRLAVSAGARLSDHVVPLAGAWNMGVSVGIDTYRSRDMELALKVKRLDGSRVAVSLEEVTGRGDGTALSARAGISGPVPQLPEKGGRAGEIANRTLTAQAQRWLNAEASIAVSERTANREIQTFVMDLDTPSGRQAYEAALALDLRPAQKAAAQGDPALRAITYDEQARTERRDIDARIGGLTLVDDERQVETGHGRLTRPEGVMVVDRADLLHAHEDIVTRWFSGRKRTERQLLTVTPESGGARETWLRSKQEIKVDLSTTEGAVRRFLVLARHLDLRQAADGLEDDGKTLDAFGKSERRVEAYVTAEGLERLYQADPDRIREAFATAYEEIDQPWDQPVLFDSQKASIWRRTPWLATDHADHSEVMALLRQGPQPNGPGNEGPTPDQRYANLTGRPLWQDAEAWRESERLVELLGKMREAGPADRARLLAGLAKEMDTDLARELSTMARLAGPETVVVPEMRLSGPKAPDLLYRRGDAPRDPRKEIDAAIRGHRTP